MSESFPLRWDSVAPERPRVVVTGLGAITPLGISVEELWSGLLAGRSGVGAITSFDPTGLPTRIAAEVRNFDPLAYLDTKLANRLERVTQFAVAAAMQAIGDSGINLEWVDRERFGVVMNTGGGGIVAIEREALVLANHGPRRISPLFVPMMMPNIVACQVSIALGLLGPVMTQAAACASGILAIVDAMHVIRRGDADIVVAGGTESAMSRLGVAALGNMHATSRRNDDPAGASRPFDRGRDGFVFGEGAGAMILESLAHARARGAHIYAEVLGGALTADAHHIAAPDPAGRGAGRAMSRAIADAGICARDIGLVVAHATGTPMGDVVEARAIHQALGAHGQDVPVTAPKSMLGHLLGAAGAIASVISVRSIADRLIPPTINLDNPDEACNLNVVTGVARKLEQLVAIANGFGFGGQNATVVFGDATDQE
jgi:3-oxoacyl-[acyl-carrier-protein] synthase II